MWQWEENIRGSCQVMVLFNCLVWLQISVTLTLSFRCQWISFQDVATRYLVRQFRAGSGATKMFPTRQRKIRYENTATNEADLVLWYKGTNYWILQTKVHTSNTYKIKMNKIGIITNWTTIILHMPMHHKFREVLHCPWHWTREKGYATTHDTV